MTAQVEMLFDLPIKVFHALPRSTLNEYVYLINSPIRGVDCQKSQNKISIGNVGSLYYLNSVTYNIGYIFELPITSIMFPTHILVGSVSTDLQHIGNINMLYFDANILVLENKQNSSYLILPSSTEDIPQPVV